MTSEDQKPKDLHWTKDKKILVKARKASRLGMAFVIFGGAILLLYGLLTSYFPTILNGVVLLAASVIPAFVWKKVERHLNEMPN